MISIESKRLKLVKLVAQDWQYFKRLHLESSCIRFITSEMDHSEIRSKFEERLMPWNTLSTNWLCLRMEEKETGRIVGLNGFRCFGHQNRIAEVGYMLSPDSVGMGYATESLLAVLDFGFSCCSIHKFVARVTSGNHASIGVLTKAGFVHEGTLRSQVRLNSTWHDDLNFGLLASDRMPT